MNTKKKLNKTMQSDPHNVVLDEVNVDQSQQKTPNVKTTERTNLPSVRQSERAKRLARRREIRQQKMTEMTETSEGDTTEAGGDDSPTGQSHSGKDPVQNTSG